MVDIVIANPNNLAVLALIAALVSVRAQRYRLRADEVA
jgi:hypothetical protein